MRNRLCPHPRSSLLFGAVLIAASLACQAQNSGFNLDLHANAHATAKDIGLPVYPHSTLYKDGDNDSSANLGIGLNDFHFGLLVVNYATGDSPAQVLDYYRKPLSRYGDVLECFHGKPVGSLTVARSGLTCSDKQNSKAEVNGISSDDHELRAGSPLRFRIVGIQSSPAGKTRFALVSLELPKDSNSTSN